MNRGILIWIAIALVLGAAAAGVTRALVRAQRRPVPVPQTEPAAPRAVGPATVVVPHSTALPGPPAQPPRVDAELSADAGPVLALRVPLAPLPRSGAAPLLAEAPRTGAPDAGSGTPDSATATVDTVDAGPPAAPADGGVAPPADAGAAWSAPGTAEPVPSVPVRVLLQDDNGTWLKLVSAEVSLDQRKVVSLSRLEGIRVGDGLVAWEGTLFPGTHQVRAIFVYKGAGGVFGYLEGYTIRAKDTRTVVVAEGQTPSIMVRGADRGATYEFAARPQLAISVE